MLDAYSVVALNCAECEADLRGEVKVQHGDRYLCATCAMREEWLRDHDPQLTPHGDAA